MADPTFVCGSSHTAKVQVSNPTGKSFTYAMELYLGVTKVASSSKSVTIPAGGEQWVDFPVVMPPNEGTWAVYLDVSVAGTLIAHYQATEDVEIVDPLTPAPPDEAWPDGYVTLHGYVRDKWTGQPIGNALIWEGWEGAYSDANGYYIHNRVRDRSRACPSGWGISCNRSGYLQAIKTVLLHKGDIRRLDFSLEAK